MFKLANKIIIERTVRIRVPQAGSGFRDEEFRALFEVIDPDVARTELGEQDEAGTTALLRRVFVGWPEGAIGDEGGAPLAFSEEARDQLIAIPYVRLGLLRAYGKAVNAVAEKN